MTVLFRSFDQLIGHPLLRHLPTHSLGALFYREVTRMIHPSLHALSFTIRLTDDKVSSLASSFLVIIIIINWFHIIFRVVGARGAISLVTVQAVL